MRDNVLAAALQQKIQDCPQYARLLSRTAKSFAGELTIGGLFDSAKSLILSMLLGEVKRPFFLVVADNHQAASYYQEIYNLSRYPTFLYPASEVSPYEQVLSSADTIAQQMEVLEHIIRHPDSPYVVVLPIRAFGQRVLDQETLKANTITIKVGQSLNQAELASSLVRLGYTRENLVTLRGEFSIRGDITDIYPSQGPPLRFEMFGDEVESMRAFSVESQRSREELDTAIIAPRWWVVIDKPEDLLTKMAEALSRASASLSYEAGESLKSVVAADMAVFEAGQFPESAEYFAPFVHQKYATVADYMPNDSLCFVDEWDAVTQAMQSHIDKLTAAQEEGLAGGRLLPLPYPLHKTAEELATVLKEKKRIFISSLPHFDELNGGAANYVQFDCHGIERFNNQMPQFIERVRAWRKDGLRIVITTDQPQRVMGILKEWDCPAKYVPGAGDIASGKDLQEMPTVANLSDLVVKHGTDAAGSAWLVDQNDVWVTRQGFVSGFRLSDIRLVSVTDAELFGLKRKPAQYRRPVQEKREDRLYSLSDLRVGDYVVHVKQGIGQFVGCERVKVDRQEREYLTIQYAGDDRLYVPADQINLLSRYRGAGGIAPRLSRMGGAEWESTKRRVKRSTKQVAEDLVNLYAMRAKQEGFACAADTPWQYEMEDAFPFEETPDQWQAIVDSKADQESNKPMDRLICGDVGFGKTEVAIRSIFKTVMCGKQAAVLVPTTILAQQHFNTMVERFAPYPIRVGLLSRFRTAKEQREIVQRLSVGECDVVVGTHRLLQKDIAFKDLGLVVIDEEQRFGVANKEKLKQLRVMVDVLTMSATPIPRTLYMALSGARDMSLINTPPVNRAPIKTFVGEYKPALVRTAILHELERGGQVYFVHNRVESIEAVAHELKELVPEARISIGHGQMDERTLEAVMLDFLSQQTDILVCTTIIESGLDIPNVNTIILDEADKLGLAQLYQLRGRVGRSNTQAFAYCLYRGNKVLSETAQDRLKAIREFTHLGSGYQIALRDMEIRGVGNILGSEQHGHMIAVGFDLYCKILEESVAELKGEATTSVDAETQIDINVTAFIPETYIADSQQKIVEYKRLADVKSERELVLLTGEWKDRFGQLPQETEQLVTVVRLRLLAQKAGVASIKPEQAGLRLSVDYRLQAWIPVQNRLPKHLAGRTTYKPGAPGGHGNTPYILVRAQGLSPEEQLSLLEELLNAMVAGAKPS
jgi:transcription-repair coupling factor (superfamily II helicase)